MLSKTTGLVTAVALFSASFVLAQGVPRGTAEAEIGSAKVSVEYGRPSLKGRDMLGMAPNGTIWRTGADTATTFTTSADLTVGGKALPAGSYSLFTKRIDEKTWHLIFNKQTGQWGTSHDPGQDHAEAPLKWSQSDSSVEQFTINLKDSGELSLHWGTHELALPIEAK